MVNNPKEYPTIAQVIDYLGQFPDTTLVVFSRRDAAEIEKTNPSNPRQYIVLDKETPW